MALRGGGWKRGVNKIVCENEGRQGRSRARILPCSASCTRSHGLQLTSFCCPAFAPLAPSPPQVIGELMGRTNGASKVGSAGCGGSPPAALSAGCSEYPWAACD